MIIECPHCEAKVEAEELAHHDEFDTENDPTPFRTTLLVCSSCNSAMLGGQEQLHQEDGRWVWSSGSRLWPSPKKPLSWRIPPVVRLSIEEARRCYGARAYTAAVAMSGRALEGVCRSFATKSPYLGGGLRELRDRGVIDSRLFQWSESLRTHRNMAAHATREAATRENAHDLLNFVESISEYVFVLSARFDAFRRREVRAAAKKKAATEKAIAERARKKAATLKLRKKAATEKARKKAATLKLRKKAATEKARKKAATETARKKA